MGITIHWDIRFRGSQDRLLALLQQCGAEAKKLRFRDPGELFRFSYLADFNEIDEYTKPGTPVREGVPAIDQAYRWAKIQATPRLRPFDHTHFHELTRSQQLRQEKREQQVYDRYIQRIAKMTGVCWSMWYGQGCEPTNIALNHTGDSHCWSGSCFTKTQYARDYVGAHVSVCALLRWLSGQPGVKLKVDDEGDFYDTGDITKLIDRGVALAKNIKSTNETLAKLFGAGQIETAEVSAQLVEFAKLKLDPAVGE